MPGVTGELLRGVAETEKQWNIFVYLDFWWGLACQGWAYWFWIPIAILCGLLISVDIRLHNLLKHIPKKVLKELYKKDSKKTFTDYFKDYFKKQKRK